MPEKSTPRPKPFSNEVSRREKRKLRARRQGQDDLWAGLGLFGVVGWSVAVPTVLGVFAGLWIDLKWPGPPSWTLTLMLLGIVLGCVNAGFWISRQRRRIVGGRDDERN